MSKKLPEGWKKLIIDDTLINKISGEWGKECEDENEGVYVLRTTNFTNQGKLNLDEVVKRNIEEKKVDKKKLVHGDIILEKSGGSENQPVGRVVYFDIESEDTYLCNNFTQILRPNPEIIHSKYLLYVLFDIHRKGITEYFQNKTTGIRNLQTKSYLEQEINIPPLEEQERIVSILEKAEKVIQKRKESSRLLDEYLKSVFIDMFGDPVTNNKGWKKIELKDISNYLKRGKSPKYSDRSSINVINQKCIYWRDFKPENCKCYNEEFIDKIKGEFLDRGDIVINSTGTGTLGRALVLKNIKSNSYVADSHITVIKVNECANPVYITTLLEFKNIQSQVYAKCVNGSTNQIELSVSKLGSYKIMVPPIESQNKFADIVNQVDKLKVQMESSLKELENNFNSLMQKAFNGEL